MKAFLLSHAARDKGLTLVELVAVVALLGLVLAAIYSFFFSGLDSWQRGLDRMDHQQSARIAVDQIVDDLRFAYSLSGLEQGQAAAQVTYTVKNDSGVFEERRFRLLENEIVREKLSESGTVVSHIKVAMGIKEINFSRDDNNEVHITIVAGQDTAAVTMQSSVRPRNLP